MSGRDSAGNAGGWEEAHPRAAAALATLVRLVERLGSALAPGRAGGGAP